MKALLIVDMLNDFVKPDGKLPVEGAETIIENICKIKSEAEKYNVKVIYANDAHTKDDPEFKVWPEHCVQGTYGAKIIDQLPTTKNDTVIEKRDLSMFTNPEADRFLKNQGIDELLVTGVATEYCVRGAILDALKENYKVNLVVDAIAGVDLQKGDQYRALIEMGQAGATPVYTKDVLEKLME